MIARLVGRLAALVFVGCLAVADPALALRLSGSFAPLAPGLEIAEGAALDDGAEIPLTLVRVDPARYGVRVGTPADLAPPPDAGAAAGGHTLREYFHGLGAAAVLSGGLLATTEPPASLGLVVAGGRVVSPPHRGWGTSGLFCTGPGGTSIRPFDPAAMPATGTADCLQSGPLLVGPDGAASEERLRRAIGVDYTRDFVEGRHRRAFVALDRDGRVLLGVTGPIELPRLAEILAVAADPAVLDVAAALNLTGAQTAGLLVGVDAVELRAGNPDGPSLPNAIAVLPPGGAGREPARPSPAG